MVQDKALELQGREGHREIANPEESQDMEQQVVKTHGCVDVLAMHKEASLEITEDVALEYILEPVEELDILGLGYTSEPELRDIWELGYNLEQEEELRDIRELEYNLEQEEVELRDSGQHVLGAPLP